jgi:hypothetical protein
MREMMHLFSASNCWPRKMLSVSKSEVSLLKDSSCEAAAPHKARGWDIVGPQLVVTMHNALKHVLALS